MGSFVDPSARRGLPLRYASVARALWRLAAFIAIGSVAVGCDRTAAVAHSSPVAVAAAAAAIEPFPTPVVELSGSPDDMGTAHARALHDPIEVLHDQYLMRLIGSPARHFIATSAAGVFESLMFPPHRDEALAMARQLKMDPAEAVLAQCFLDMLPSTACSTITLTAAASPDHVARFGRNLDFTSFNIADKYTTVFIYRPRARYAIASVGWPGLIGVLSGMNERGLCLANMEVPRSLRLPSAMPYPLLYRLVLERCATVDEAVALLRATPRQSANNLMLMDAGGARAVAEITPESVIVRAADDGRALISTNHQRGQEADAPGKCRRYDSLHRAAMSEFGHIDRAAMESMLNDAAQGQHTLQSMIFEPATRTLYLATGKHASARPFYALDLKTLFNVNEGSARSP